MLYFWEFSVLKLFIRWFSKKFDNKHFKYTRQVLDGELSVLVKQKAFYPYVYKDNFEKFSKSLLSKDKFYSLLTRYSISGKDYEHVVKVWNSFEIKTTEQYHRLCTTCDVLPLADVLETLRKTFLEYYWLYPRY